MQNETKHALARIPLRWMIRECFKKDTGIRFHGELLKEIGMNPATLYPVVQPRPPALESATVQQHEDMSAKTVPTVLTGGTEEDHEYRNARAKLA